MGCIYLIVDTILTFTIMLIGVYQVISKYKLSGGLLILLFLASFIKYLDLPPKNPDFNRSLISIFQGIEVLFPLLMVVSIAVDMNIDPWKYKLEKEQYRDSFMNYALFYWHAKRNFLLVAKLTFLNLMQLCSAGSVYSIATENTSCPGAAGLAIITIISDIIIFVLNPQILEKGYENLQLKKIESYEGGM